MLPLISNKAGCSSSPYHSLLYIPHSLLARLGEQRGISKKLIIMTPIRQIIPWTQSSSSTRGEVTYLTAKLNFGIYAIDFSESCVCATFERRSAST